MFLLFAVVAGLIQASHFMALWIGLAFLFNPGKISIWLVGAFILALLFYPILSCTLILIHVVNQPSLKKSELWTKKF